MKAQIAFLFILTTLLITGCGPSFRANEIPHEQARVEDLGGVPSPRDNDNRGPNPLPGEESSQENPPPSSPPSPPPSPQSGQPTQPAANESDAPRTSNEAPAKLNPHSLIETAKWVIQNEAKQVGPACNLFVQRVLQLMGFERKNFMANNFDWYAKDKFSSYQLESFPYDSARSQLPRIHDYIWSFPEGTGFILQWKQKSGHGHIAIVQRIQDTLVIYHAGLNTFNPKAQTIPLERLLHRRKGNYVLNIFSNFKK